MTSELTDTLIAKIDERIDMKLGVTLEAIDDKLARLLEVIQVQFDQLAAELKTNTERLEKRLEKIEVDINDLKVSATLK